MKKRAYRATNVNRIDREKLRIAVDGGRLIAGVDVAKKVQFACLADESGLTLRTMKWSHPKETDKAIDFLRSLGASAVEIVMEPSGTYGDPLRYQFERAGFGVWFVSGKRTHDAREVFDGVPSLHDGKATHILVRLHLQNVSERYTPLTSDERDLAAAVETEARRQDRYFENLSRLEARCAAHWPELCGVLDLSRSTVHTLLAAYGSPAEVAANQDAARTLMKGVGGRFLTDEKVDEVIDAAKQSTGVPMTGGERRALVELVRELQGDKKAARAARQHLEERGAQFEDALRLSKLCGKKTAAVLRAEIGPPGRYRSAQAYQKSFGLNLKVLSSGTGKKGGLHVTKRGSSKARKVMFMFALRVVRSDPVVRSWYLKKVARDGGGCRLKAVVAVMRKLCLALWHVGRGAEYSAAMLFDVSRLELPHDLATDERVRAECAALEKGGLQDRVA